MRSNRGRLLAAMLLIPIGLVAWQVGRYLQADGQRRAARRAIDARAFAAARRHLDACQRAWPGDSSTLLLASETARRDGDLDAARRHLQAAQEAGAVAAAVDLERRLLRFQRGELDEAERYLRYAREHPDTPQTPLILEAIITGALAVLDLPLAGRALEPWLRQRNGEADRVQGLLWQGDLAVRGGAYETALLHYRQAAALAPDLPAVRLRLAEILVRYAPREAVGLLEPLLADRPADRAVRLLLARARRALGDLDEAQRLLEALLTDDAADPGVQVERGQVALDLNRPAEAEPFLRRAEQLAPARRDVPLALARCLQMAGRDDEARLYRARVARLDAEVQRRFPQPAAPKEPR